MDRNINIYFLRHGKLALLYKNHSEMPYQVLVDLSMKKLNPGIDKDSKSLFLKNNKVPLDQIDIIFHSRSKRSIESAHVASEIIAKQYHKTVPVRENNDLREIEFNIKKLISEKDYIKGSIKAINKVVLKAMVYEHKVESFDKAYDRARSFFKELKKSQEQNKIILCISHDFFMRVLEIYIKNKGGRIKISEENLYNTSQNIYFGGFATSYNLDIFRKN